MPQITRPQVHRVVYELLPRPESFRETAAALLRWRQETPQRNAAAQRSPARRRARERYGEFSLAALFKSSRRCNTTAH